MAVINHDGTTGPLPRLLGGAGTSLRGMIRISFASLVRAFGEPDTIEDIPPTWVVLIRTADPGAPSQLATVYLEDRIDTDADVIACWNVGGHEDDVVSIVARALNCEWTGPAKAWQRPVMPPAGAEHTAAPNHKDRDKTPPSTWGDDPNQRAETVIHEYSEAIREARIEWTNSPGSQNAAAERSLASSVSAAQQTYRSRIADFLDHASLSPGMLKILKEVLDVAANISAQAGGAVYVRSGHQTNRADAMFAKCRASMDKLADTVSRMDEAESARE